MAFCGALALLSFLARRKVRDPGDNRTNLYLLGLAHSSAGKDWPRKINVPILHEIGLADCVGERFASGEGIQDSLLIHPATLFQTDEIDGILQSINKSRDARYENIMSTLLTLYSSANSVFPMRRKAGGELPGVIDQPCLTIFGTAIPNHYYEAGTGQLDRIEDFVNQTNFTPRAPTTLRCTNNSRATANEQRERHRFPL